jgi:hypothetical protein
LKDDRFMAEFRAFSPFCALPHRYTGSVLNPPPSPPIKIYGQNFPHPL